MSSSSSIAAVSREDRLIFVVVTTRADGPLLSFLHVTRPALRTNSAAWAAAVTATLVPLGCSVTTTTTTAATAPFLQLHDSVRGIWCLPVATKLARCANDAQLRAQLLRSFTRPKQTPPTPHLARLRAIRSLDWSTCVLRQPFLVAWHDAAAYRAALAWCLLQRPPPTLLIVSRHATTRAAWMHALSQFSLGGGGAEVSCCAVTLASPAQAMRSTVKNADIVIVDEVHEHVAIPRAFQAARALLLCTAALLDSGAARIARVSTLTGGGPTSIHLPPPAAPPPQHRHVMIPMSPAQWWLFLRLLGSDSLAPQHMFPAPSRDTTLARQCLCDAPDPLSSRDAKLRWVTHKFGSGGGGQAVVFVPPRTHVDGVRAQLQAAGVTAQVLPALTPLPPATTTVVCLAPIEDGPRLRACMRAAPAATTWYTLVACPPTPSAAQHGATCEWLAVQAARLWPSTTLTGPQLHDLVVGTQHTTPDQTSANAQRTERAAFQRACETLTAAAQASTPSLALPPPKKRQQQQQQQQQQRRRQKVAAAAGAGGGSVLKVALNKHWRALCPKGTSLNVWSRYVTPVMAAQAATAAGRSVDELVADTAFVQRVCSALLTMRHAKGLGGSGSGSDESWSSE